MNNTSKNIITNALAFIFWVLAIYEYFTDKDMYFILGFTIIGLALFVFKISETKSFLSGFINKKINGK